MRIRAACGARRNMLAAQNVFENQVLKAVFGSAIRAAKLQKLVG
jgi:hypothetical protein